jgi:peptidoglycan/xylan/chitin deacetylase (PgdA/CDA1 family)
LDEQIRFLKRRFHLATLDEMLEALDKPPIRRAMALLTFDDGYRDNYEAALPVLSAHRAQGVFFLPTSYIGTNRIAFWDAVAFVVKGSRKPRFRLSPAPLREFDIAADGAPKVIEQVLNLYKCESGGDAGRFLAGLEEACDSPRPDGSERLFMNWEEAAEMARAGMAIGSHTHSHPVLAQTEPQDLARELTHSKSVLEERLRVPVRTLAYPFGLQETISPAVFKAAEVAGYDAAFSFYGGVNLPGAIERYNLRRQPVCPADASTFRLRTALAATGRRIG